MIENIFEGIDWHFQLTFLIPINLSIRFIGRTKSFRSDS